MQLSNEKKERSKKSHISLPRYLIKKFIDRNCDNYVLRTETNEVMRVRKHERQFQKQGYYTDEIEDYFSNNIERIFGLLVAEVENYNEGKPLEFQSVELIHEAIELQVSRSKYIQDKLNNIPFFSKREDYARDYIKEITESSKSNKVFKSIDVTILVDKTKTGFIVGSNMITDLGISLPTRNLEYIVVLSPKVAIAFQGYKNLKNGTHSNVVIDIKMEKDIMQVNRRIAFYEKKYGKSKITEGYLLGSKKNLDLMKSFLSREV